MNAHAMVLSELTRLRTKTKCSMGIYHKNLHSIFAHQLVKLKVSHYMYYLYVRER